MPPAERAINRPTQQAIEAINNSAITASEISDEEVDQALTPIVPAPPYAPPPPAARPQPVLTEEEEVVIHNAVSRAMQPWVHEVAQRVLPDIAALQEQLTDVQDRHVVGERQLEGLETRLNTNNERTVRAHHAARDALNMSMETFNALRPIATAISEVPGLLGAMQRLIERNTKALKAIHEGNEINRDIIIALDNRITAFMEEHGDPSDSSSSTTERSRRTERVVTCSDSVVLGSRSGRSILYCLCEVLMSFVML
ncbi:hypothetical protein FS749_002749 [Ceratobasidium sp. UAMH 11750]|nr:hypothetical protein FS749_002749 [Ceratobasidium sp. UAMH 11750]